MQYTDKDFIRDNVLSIKQYTTVFLNMVSYRMNTHYFTQESQPYSPWSLCGFVRADIYYPTLEHYIAIQKLQKIGETAPDDFWNTPHAQYAYDTARHATGRTNWDEYEQWLIEAQEARMLSHLWLYEEFLQQPEDRYAYANKDMRLGVGLPPQSPDVRHEERWKGENRMGLAIQKASLQLPTLLHVSSQQLMTAQKLLEHVLMVINHMVWTAPEKKDILVDKKLVFYTNAALLSLGYPELPKADSLKDAQQKWTESGNVLMANLQETIASLQSSGDYHVG